MLKFNSRNCNIVFSSDLHLNHTNYCKGTSTWINKEGCREFDSLEKMNTTILQPFLMLPENTILFLLGDTLFGNNKDYYKLFDQINAREIYHIHGNHENINSFSANIHPKIKWSGDILKIIIDGRLLILSHRPFFSWEDMDRTIHLHGHTHGEIKYPEDWGKDRHLIKAFDTIDPSKSKPMILDVGIDNYYKVYKEYKPFTWKQINNICK